MKYPFAAISGFARDIEVLEAGERREAKAFIQAISVLSPEERTADLPLGLSDERRWLFIAEPTAIAHGGDGIEIICGDRRYEMLRCEMLGGGSHWEGLLRLKAGDGDA